MKKNIVFLMIIFGQLVFAQVDNRLVYVSNTRDFPSSGLSTLVLDVEAISNSGDVQINVFQNAIQIDENFRTQYLSVSFTNQLFPSSSYNTTQYYRSTDGRMIFVYSYNTGSKGTINSTYTRVLTISIQYITAASMGSISWFTGIPNYSVNDGNNTLITRIRVPIPSELNSIALPVELTSFTSKLLNDKVLLNWSTKTETNNFGFDVERCALSAERQEWEKIGFVEGNGNSNSPKEYSFTDKNLVGGSKFQYRLKQIDNDGQFEYSKVVEVEIVPNEFALYQNYPNPFNPVTKIRYQLPNESKVVIKIYNILGSEVMELVNEQKESGIYEVEFNAEQLSSGTYFYKISAIDPSTGSGQVIVQTKKMLLLK